MGVFAVRVNGDERVTRLTSPIMGKRHLIQRYWGRHFWVIGYGRWTIANITDEISSGVFGTPS